MGRIPKEVAKGDNTGEGYRHMALVETGLFDETVIPRETLPSGSELDNKVVMYKKGG